jgi:hypothetical protein
MRWQRIPTTGGGVAAILTRGSVVHGWVVSTSGLVWTSYMPPRNAVPPDEKVNVFTGGDFVGCYPTAEVAMQVVQAKALRKIERRYQERAARKSQSGQAF